MLCLWMAELSGWNRDHVVCKAKNNYTWPATKTVRQTLFLILTIPRSLSSHWPFLLISSRRCSRAISNLRPRQCSSLLPQTCSSSLPVSVNCVIIKPRFLQQRLWELYLILSVTPTLVFNLMQSPLGSASKTRSLSVHFSSSSAATTPAQVTTTFCLDYCSNLQLALGFMIPSTPVLLHVAARILFFTLSQIVLLF